MSKGFKIAHNLKDFVDGQDQVLVLKDTNILDGNNLNSEDDVLENIDLNEKERIQYNLETKERLKNVGQEHIIEKYGYSENRTLLAKYDEKAPKKDGFYLDQEGSYNQEKIKKLEEIKNKLSNKSKGLELNVEKKIASDYYTQNEVKQMKIQPKINKKKAQDLYKFLEDNADNDVLKDHGSRVNKKIKIDEIDDIEYKELQESLQKQRNIQQKKQVNVEDDLQNYINQDQEKQVDLDYKEFQLNQQKQGKQELSQIEFSTDFLKTVKNAKDQNESKMKILEPTPISIGTRDTKYGITSVVNVSLPSEKQINYLKCNDGIQSIIKQKNLNVTAEEYIEKIIQDPKQIQEEIGFLQDEQAESRGMGDILQRLRQRGDLQNNGVEFLGRAKDKNPQQELEKYGLDVINQNEVKLEYRDAKGRMMTQKEAFRFLLFIQILMLEISRKRTIQKQIRKENEKRTIIKKKYFNQKKANISKTINCQTHQKNQIKVFQFCLKRNLDLLQFNQMQIERVQLQAKLLYEDLVKTMIRIFPFNDLEIVLANYLIEKAKMNDQAKEEEDISIEINVILIFYNTFIIIKNKGKSNKLYII